MPRDIQLPDGRLITLTGNETPEQIAAFKQRLSAEFATQPAQEPLGEFARTVGRGGRDIAAAGAGVLDIGLLPLKTLALGAGLRLEKGGG